MHVDEPVRAWAEVGAACRRQLAASFTLRNHVDGFAVEQQFALNSPLLRGIRKVKVCLHTHTNTHTHAYTHTHAHTHPLTAFGRWRSRSPSSARSAPSSTTCASVLRKSRRSSSTKRTSTFPRPLESHTLIDARRTPRRLALQCSSLPSAELCPRLGKEGARWGEAGVGGAAAG